MRITFRQFPGKFTRFVPHLFDRFIGKQVTLHLGMEECRATLVSAEVEESGVFVDLTVDLSRDVFPNAHLSF